MTYQAGEGAHHRSVTESDRDRADAHELRKRESEGRSGQSRGRDISRAWEARERGGAHAPSRGCSCLRKAHPTCSNALV